MIESFEIRNFRCFADLNTTALKRFNIVVGESGSGKTALMEGLFLLGGANPEIYLRLRGWRGLGPTVSIGTKDSYESIFRDLFFDFEQSKGASLSSVDNKTGRRRVDINYKNQDSFSLPLKGIDDNAFQIDPIIFKWQVGDRVFESSLELKDGAFKITGSAPVSPVSYFNAVNTSARENSTSFSSLSRRFKAHRLLSAVSEIFPVVKDLTLEIVAGEPVIHVSTGLSQRLPLGDLSGWPARYLVPVRELV